MAQRLKRKVTAALAGVGLAALGTAGHAQTSSPAPAPTTGDDQQLEEIVVTAERRAESLQDVPIAVSAISSDRLEASEARDIEDLFEFVPGLAGQSDGSETNLSIKIRGVGGDDPGNPGVGYYLDGVYLNQFARNVKFFDIERVEVLRGPQGTLYGRNTAGGAINIISRKPDNQVRGLVDGAFGNFDYRQIGAGISGPLVRDKLAARLSVDYSKRDGFDRNTVTGNRYGGLETKSVRGTLRLTPSEALDISLTGSWSKLEEQGYAYVALDDPNQKRRGILSLDFEGFSNVENKNLALSMSYELGWGRLESVTAYNNTDYRTLVDVDFSPADGVLYDGTFDLKTTTQELRFLSPTDGPVDFIVGAYGFWETQDYLDGIRLGVDFGGPLVALTPDLIKTRNYAGFGQVSAELGRFTITGGLRYDSDRRRQTDPTGKRGRTFKEWLPKVTVDYKFGEDVLGYATFAEGYKSGGFNALTLAPPGFLIFGTERTNNYELGLKSTLFNRRVRANLAAFYIKWDDYQLLINEPKPGGGFFEYTDNQGRVSSRGLEVEIDARVARGFDAGISGSYTKVKYDEYEGAAGDLDGNRVPYIPLYQLSAYVQYVFNLSGELEGLARGEVSHRGSEYFDETNEDRRDPYTLFNARLGLRRAGLDVALFCRNCFDEFYVYRFGGGLGVNGQPRTYGISASYRF